MPDRKRELDPGSSSQSQGDEKMEIPEGVQAASERNNFSLSTGKGEPAVKQVLVGIVNCFWLFLQQSLGMTSVLISCISL